MRLLLFEYLHADAAGWQSAPQGMRREGQAMVLALIRDAASLKSVATTVLLCEPAARELRNLIPDSVAIRVAQSDSVLCSLVDASRDSDCVFPIAPESDQLLLLLARQLKLKSCHTLLPSTSFIATCSDKYETWQTFRTIVPMVDCWLPDQVSPDGRLNDMVIKPRWGAGCEAIRRAQNFASLPPDGLICQPWMEGRWLSVGIIGGPTGRRILPIAEQRIDWAGNVPRYSGSNIPADIDSPGRQQIANVVERLLAEIEFFTGYVGLDLLLTFDGRVFLNEINPRLCTSYIDYQRVLPDNLLKHMLGISMESSPGSG